MANAQLGLLFLCGFLLSRLLVKARVPEQLVARLFSRELSVSRIVLYIVALSAFLSVLIPNAVTAITFIPIVTLIRQKLVDQELGDETAITTALALAVIYGANVGGMASITATPANGVLVAYAALRRIPDHGVLRFDAWLLWGIPLTAVLVVLAWVTIVVCSSKVRWAGKATAFHELATEDRTVQHAAQRMALGFLVGSVVLSSFMHAASQKAWVLGFTAIAAAGFGWRLFGPRHPRPLLTWSDCFRGLPWRGLGIVAIIVVITVVAGLLGILDYTARAGTRLLPSDLATVGAFAWIALVASFATQLMSNTVVQLALFETLAAHPGSRDLLIDLLLVVTLSSTCAFMTPVATGVSGLVYGEMRGTSFRGMIFTGAVMNVIAALVITGCIYYVVARV